MQRVATFTDHTFANGLHMDRGHIELGQYPNGNPAIIIIGESGLPYATVTIPNGEHVLDHGVHHVTLDNNPPLENIWLDLVALDVIELPTKINTSFIPAKRTVTAPLTQHYNRLFTTQFA